MTALTWLHLSDLHAWSPRFGWDADRVLEPWSPTSQGSNATTSCDRT